MLAQIINRCWTPSPRQSAAIFQNALTRRRLFYRGAMVVAGAAFTAALAGCKNGIDLSTLTPALVQYAADIAAALKTALATLSGVSGLPTAVTSILTSINTWVSNIASVALGINTSTLVSTASGDVASIVTDFNQIVTAIISSPVVSAALSATSFGWAVYAIPAVLSVLEQAVGVVTSILNPPAPVVSPVVPASARWHAKMTERVGAAAGVMPVLDPATADLILQEIAGGAR